MKRDELFLIDFEKKGNQLRLFFGEDKDYYGDDWNDAPYQHNAGRVYERYIKDTAVLSFYYDDIVLEPADEYNLDVSKDDFVEMKIPAFVVLRVKDRKPGIHYTSYTFNQLLGMHNVFRFYFGMTVSEINDILEKHIPYVTLDFSENFNYF